MKKQWYWLVVAMLLAAALPASGAPKPKASPMRVELAPEGELQAYRTPFRKFQALPLRAVRGLGALFGHAAVPAPTKISRVPLNRSLSGSAITALRADPGTHRLLAYVVPADAPQGNGAWMTAAGMDGLLAVAIKVAADGTLATGADPGGAVQGCQTCVVIGGMNGLTSVALKVGADGTVATSGGGVAISGSPAPNDCMKFVNPTTITTAGATCAGPVTATTLNTAQPFVLDTRPLAGVDLGARLNTCNTQLGATGGICDITNEGTQDFSTAITISNPIMVRGCGNALTIRATWTLSGTGASIMGCPNQLLKITQQFAGTGIVVSGTDNSVIWVNWTCNAATFACLDVLLSSASRSVLEHNIINRWVTAGISSSNSVQVKMANNWINDDSFATGPQLLITGGDGIIDGAYLATTGAHNGVTVSGGGNWTISKSQIFMSGSGRHGISQTGNGTLILISNPTIQAGSGFDALTAQGAGTLNATQNTFSGNASPEVVLIGGNSNTTLFTNNTVIANNQTTAQAGIHLKGDTISAEIIGNRILMHGVTGVSYAIWLDTSAGGHFITNKVFFNQMSGQSDPTFDAGIFFDNSTSNTTASGNNIGYNTCVDMTTLKCIIRNDPINQTNLYISNGMNAGSAYGLAGSTNDSITDGFLFATLPTAGNLSVITCSDCKPTTPVIGGGTGAMVTYQNGTKRAGIVPAPATISADYTNTGGAGVFTNITGLTFTPIANISHHMHCNLVWSASAITAGPEFQITGPASPASVAILMNSAVTSTTSASAAATAFSSALNPVGASVTSGVNEYSTLDLDFINGAFTTAVQVQAAPQGVGTLTIRAGSGCQIQ